MSSKYDKEDLVELGGHEFKRVKNGLDESEVASFINELIGQLDTMKQRQDHLSSLTKLAERTIAEADNISQEIQLQATEQAKAKAAEITARAETQAQVIVEEKRKMNDFVHQLYSQLSVELESLRQRVADSQQKFEHRLDQHEKDTVDMATKTNQIQHDEEIDTPVEADEAYPEDKKDAVTSETNQFNSELLDLVQTVGQTEGTKEESDLELEVLPPIDVTKLMGVLAHVDALSEVENTEIIPRAPDRPSIMVFLREPINLIEVLRTLPEVAEVKGDVINANSANGGKPKKIQVVLSGTTMLQQPDTSDVKIRFYDKN